MSVKRQLDAPPIIEVVCGIFYAPIPAIDPVSVGALWERLRETYPTHAIHPAISDGLPFVVLPGRLRSWFVSRDDVYVVQIQADRFYVNWRKRADLYPRFSDREGKEGVLARALREFDVFAEDCERRLGQRPRPATVELSKVDLLVQGEHWTDLADLV